MLSQKKILEKFAPHLGELAQHELTHDPNIKKNSDWYLSILRGVLERQFDFSKTSNPRYLEIACYRHILGYQLASEYGFESTLFDISDRDLQIGRETAIENGLQDSIAMVDRVAGDFHDLPFRDGYFDFAYVSASLHHTLQPEDIISEMMRVLKPGGLFYCQREPCERMFCFYLFNANRPAQHTPMEAVLQERDTLRLFSSPFHGARNADVFARIENDRIPLNYYYDVFAKYGQILEQILYHEGLLTRLDKEILEQEALSVDELTDFVYERLLIEVNIMQSNLGDRERLLGYKTPSKVTIMGMARRVASALKARPEDQNSIAWKKAMVEIFGGNLRFVVKRFDDSDRPENHPSKTKKTFFGKWKKKSVITNLQSEEGERDPQDQKFRRNFSLMNYVKYDDALYKEAPLQLWNKLLPDIQNAEQQDLFDSAFLESDWRYVKTALSAMVSQVAQPKLSIKNKNPVVVVIRYRIKLDEELFAAKLHVNMNNENVSNEFIPQIEDRLMRLYCDQPQCELSFKLTDLSGNQVSMGPRLVITILQCVPVQRNE